MNWVDGALLAVLVIYLIITGVSDLILRWIDRRYSVGVRRA